MLINFTQTSLKKPKVAWKLATHSILNLLEKSLALDPVSFSQLMDTLPPILSFLFCIINIFELDGPSYHYTNMLNYIPIFQLLSEREFFRVAYICFHSFFLFSFSFKLSPVRLLFLPANWALVKVSNIHVTKFSCQLSVL